MKQLLGLDVSLTGTGWCTCNAESPDFELTGFGTIKTTPNKKSKGEVIYTFSNQERQKIILDTLQEVGLLTVELVGFEDYAFAWSSTDLPETQGILRFILYMNNRCYLTMSTTSVKLFATGKGNTKKELVPMFIRTKFADTFLQFGREVPDGNAADAVGIAALTHCFYRTSRNLPFNQKLSKKELVSLGKLVEVKPTNFNQHAAVSSTSV